MQYRSSHWLICLLFAVLGASARSIPQHNYARGLPPIESTNASGPTLPPKQDPWYKAPDNFEHAKPGHIFRIRKVPYLLTIFSNASAAYQMIYRTTDSQYKPSWAVTTLVVPAANLTCNTKLLSYQIAQDSVDLNAAPSYAIQTRSDGSIVDISDALARGWYVNVPDYNGPLSSFCAGVQSGHATLDSVRAVLRSRLGLASNARYAMRGYSGGALASEWASELQVQYAPELNFAGTSIGGVTPVILDVLMRINGTVFAGLTPPGILGLASQYPGALDFVDAHLRKDGEFNATRFKATYDYDLYQAIGAFAGQDISNYFTDGMDFFQTPTATKILNTDGKMGYHGVPQMPMFVFQSVGDQVSPIRNTDALVDKYCAVGATIEYERNSLGEHVSEEHEHASRAVAFLDSVLSGTYTKTGCQISTVAISS